MLAGPIPNSGLNALTFDKAGNGYVSDSFNGVIWQVPPNGLASNVTVPPHGRATRCSAPGRV